MTTREQIQPGRTMWLPSALLLLILPGCLSIRGPKAVSGPERGSVTLQCYYDRGWENYKKWWCKGADWSSCRILIRTTGSEQEVKEGRISIRDNQESRTFTVTMGDLRGKDADTYWCGIERVGIDLAVQVDVTVVSEASPTSAPEPVTALPSTTPRTPSSNLRTFTSPLSRSLLCNIHFMILLCLKVILLGGILYAAIWLSRTYRTSLATESQPGQENLSSHAVHAQSTDKRPRDWRSGTS